jgi:hypothetical protein
MPYAHCPSVFDLWEMAQNGLELDDDLLMATLITLVNIS